METYPDMSNRKRNPARPLDRAGYGGLRVAVPPPVMNISRNPNYNNKRWKHTRLPSQTAISRLRLADYRPPSSLKSLATSPGCVFLFQINYYTCQHATRKMATRLSHFSQVRPSRLWHPSTFEKKIGSGRMLISESYQRWM